MHVPQFSKMMPRRWWLAIGLLATCLGGPLAAYQQGSFFLFDLRADDSAKGTAGRIVMAATLFTSQTTKPTARAAATVPSEFETKITSFGSDGSTLKSSDIKILDAEYDTPSSGSSFGDEPPATSGFFFTY